MCFGHLSIYKQAAFIKKKSLLTFLFGEMGVRVLKSVSRCLRQLD